MQQALAKQDHSTRHQLLDQRCNNSKTCCLAKHLLVYLNLLLPLCNLTPTSISNNRCVAYILR